MLLAIALRMALLYALVVVSAVRSLQVELAQDRAGPAKSSAKLPQPFRGGPELSPAHIRDVLELAREREQVLAAQTSIADWRQRLREHGRTENAKEQEGGEQGSGHQRIHHRRRKKRAEHNDLYASEPPSGAKSGGRNGTAALEGPDVDEADSEASVICYGPLGCFHETDHLPEMLPSSPAEVNTRFLVYTTTHRSEKPLIEFSYEELVVAGFGATYWSNGTNDTVSIPVSGGMSSSLLKTFGDLSERTVRVIVHGFGANCGLVWIYEMRTALMAVENCTVICVDWENGAKLPNYVRAAANTRLVGRQLALLLRLLRTHNGLRLSRVHLIGFSLGSHVAGFAGAEFSSASSGAPPPVPTSAAEDATHDNADEDDGGDENSTNGRSYLKRQKHGIEDGTTVAAEDYSGLWRITGLDPAGPLFEAQPPEVRLDASDARYVDVIHSNGENLILGGLGSWQPMGTVDYYPNGGRVQHGCTNLFVGAVTDIIWAPPTTVEGRSLCNHRRAYKFFIDSVAPRCHFPAFPCESYDQFATGECFECGSRVRRNGTSSACGHMGYYASNRDVGGYGQLYLRTRDEEPYCANQFRLRLRNAPDELPLRTVGRFELTLEGGDTGNGIGDGGGEAGAAALLTFNETFLLDEAREDREFHAGQWLTTILVPHPALGHRPRALTITYRPYRGGWWQRSSVGKQLWRIGPILLTTDDQKTYGSCEMLTLQADVPIRLELAPIELLSGEDSADSDDTNGDRDDGDDDDDDIGICRVLGPPERRLGENKGGATEGAAKSSIDELVRPGQLHDHFSWTPVAISIPRQAHEPQQQPHVNEKRSFPESSLHPADSHPPAVEDEKLVVRARDAAASLPLEGTLPTAAVTTSTTTTTTEPMAAQTVQLFPSRLVSFFERAERYARRTWDALFNGNITTGAGPAMMPDSLTPATGGATFSPAGSTGSSSNTVMGLPSPAPSGGARVSERKSSSAVDATGFPPSPHTEDGDTVGAPTAGSSSTTTEIRIALPTFRPLTRSSEGSVGSGRQHYTRFIPLVYDEGKDPAARPTLGASLRKGPYSTPQGEPS